LISQAEVEKRMSGWLREVVWTEPATEDLVAAADYITRDSVNYAATFVEEIKEAAASLTEFTERGQVVPEFAHTKIRELCSGSITWSTRSPVIWFLS
jgi:plasmid stabilization system protein ParE